MVVMLSEFFNSTWEKANCANCLVNTSEELSNSTVHFFNLFNQTLTCFENNLEENIESLLPSTSSEVCRHCNESYRALSNLYTEMQKMNERENKAEYGVHLCIDVEDAMNITRKLWSQFFNCSVPCHDTVPVAAVSVFILFLTVVFYLSSFLHSEQKKRKLILPKRLKSSTSFANIQENSHWNLQSGPFTSSRRMKAEDAAGPKEDKLIWQVKSLRNARTSDWFLIKNFQCFFPFLLPFLRVWIYLISRPRSVVIFKVHLL